MVRKYIIQSHFQNTYFFHNMAKILEEIKSERITIIKSDVVSNKVLDL